MHSRTGAKKETVTNNASPGGSGAGPSKASTSGTPVPGGKGNGVVAGKGKKRTRETALDNVSSKKWWMKMTEDRSVMLMMLENEVGIGLFEETRG